MTASTCATRARVGDVHPRLIRALRREADGRREPSHPGRVDRPVVASRSHERGLVRCAGSNVDAVMCTLLARGLITEVGTDADTGAVTFATTELPS